jgi:hypothetical protein
MELKCFTYPERLFGQERIRSNEKELSIVVGSGDAVKEFQCYSAILASSSTKLHSIIASCDGPLVLPHLCQHGWELFRDCVDPWHENYEAETLDPWFKHFEMNRH